MTRAKVDVEVYDSDTGTVVAESFRSSPVRIGSASWNGLRLDDRDVAPVHGQIWFDERRMCFGNLAANKRTWLDGRSVDPGSIVPLTPASVLMIGPFRLEVSRRTTNADADAAWDARSGDWVRPRSFRDSLADDTDEPTLPDISLDMWPVSSTEFTTRAVASVAVLARTLLELRRLGVPPSHARPPRSEPHAEEAGRSRIVLPLLPSLADLNDIDDVMGYLLDPAGSHQRVRELHDELGALVRWIEATTSFGKRGLA